jgi:putative membrane-bound dehydrogenase-like protein
MNLHRIFILSFAFLLLPFPSAPPCLCGSSFAADTKVKSPLTPEQALASFDTEPGLRVELVAAEPMVVSPAACAFDERGRLYVAENRGYPLGPGPGKPPAGVVALLEDADGDGRMDRRHEFATGLTFPNGVLPWKGGVIITCAPDVLWLADTDGDGKSDVREVWLTGFDDKNTTQLRVSHPTLGPDGWIYLTSGWTGPSKVRSPKFPERAAVEVKTDSRFNPFTGELEAIDGRAQFGQSFDDFGRRFICYNRVQVQHVVISALERIRSATTSRRPTRTRGHSARPAACTSIEAMLCRIITAGRSSATRPAIWSTGTSSFPKARRSRRGGRRRRSSFYGPATTGSAR